MPPDPMHAVMLACHPETPTDAVRSIAARACRKPEGKLSPSCEWAAYAFDGYRSPRVGESHTVELAPQVAVHVSPSQLELDAVISLDRLAAPYLDAPLSLALSAVVEDSDGMLSYWALKHPPGKPDFHHPEAFALGICAADLRHANS